MSTTNELAVHRLVEVLVDSADPEVRDRILLEAAIASGAAQAATLWREVPGLAAGGGETSRWLPVVARGPRELLPSDRRVRGVLEGGLDGELGSGHRVILAGAEPTRLAMALGETPGGEREHEEAIDLLEALLFTFALVDSAARENPEARTSIHGISPRAADRDAGEAGRWHHDMRNLLAGLMATKQFLDIYEEDLVPEESREAGRAVERECARVGALLVSALSGPGQGAEDVVADPGEVVRDVARTEAERFRPRGVAVDFRAEPTGLEVALDEVSLARIAVNLIVNACEACERNATGAGGRVSVETHPSRGPDPGLVLVVEDSGPGIPERLLDRIFREGESEHRSETRGLGLAVVSDLVRRGGGHVRARNRPTGGARFEVWLPSA